MKDLKTTFEELNSRVNSGTLPACTLTELQRFCNALCWSQAYSYFGAQQYTQVCETVRLILLQKHLAAIEARSNRYQWLVIVLAIAALLTSVLQLLN